MHMSDMPPPDWKPPQKTGASHAHTDTKSRDAARSLAKGVSGYVATSASHAKASPAQEATRNAATNNAHSTAQAHPAVPTAQAHIDAPVIDEAEVARRIHAQIQGGDESIESALRPKSVNRGAAAGRLRIAGDGGDALAEAQLHAANRPFKLGPLAWAAVGVYLLIGPLRTLLEADDAGFMSYLMLGLGTLLGIGVVFGLAWCAFRMFRRSVAAGNIVFCSLLGLGILGNVVMLMVGGAITELLRAELGPRSAVAETIVIENPTTPDLEEPGVDDADAGTSLTAQPEAKATVIPPVSRTPNRTIEEAMESAMQGVMDKLQPLVEEHRAAFEELQKLRDDLSKEGLDKRIVAVRRALAANRSLDREYTAAPKKLSDLLRYEGFVEKDCTQAVIKEFPDQRIAKTTELRAAQKELCAALEGEARLLQGSIDRWNINPKTGDLVFNKADDLQRYQRMHDAVLSIDQRHDAILEAMKKQR